MDFRTLSNTELLEESARMPPRMAASDYVWWIEQETRGADGSVTLTRLHHYGPFRGETAAKRQIEELRRTERYRQVILVASKRPQPKS